MYSYKENQQWKREETSGCLTCAHKQKKGERAETYFAYGEDYPTLICIRQGLRGGTKEGEEKGGRWGNTNFKVPFVEGKRKKGRGIR